MEFGIGYFPTHDAVGPGVIARLVEEHGFESLLFAEHTHIPATLAEERPEGGIPPRKYWQTYDPFVALTAAAEATTRLRIGTGICLVTERDPIITAKQVASIDHLSGGRFLFGVGAGWLREEMGNHGTDPRTRMTLMRERIEAMKAIWTQDEATYHGDFVNFERILSWPKPAQRPHPPIIVGGAGRTVLDRVVSFGDAWMPNYDPDGGLIERANELRARADRPVAAMLMGAPADPRVIEQFANAGFATLLHWLPSVPLSGILPELEAWEAAIGEFQGNV